MVGSLTMDFVGLDDGSRIVLAASLTLIGIASLYAPLLMWRIYRADRARPKLWLPLTLARSLTVIVVPFVFLCVVGVVRNLIGAEPLRTLTWLPGAVDIARFVIGLGLVYLWASVIRNA
jgi:uncharacterized membrane protein